MRRLFARRPALRGSVCLALPILIGCTVVSDEQRFPPNPEKLSILRTAPDQDADGVSPDVQVDLCMSNLVDPRTVTDADATLSSGAQRFDSALRVQLVPWTGAGGAPLTPDAVEPWCPGSVLSVTPSTPLPPGVLYRVRVRPTVRGWAGERLDTDAPGWAQTEDDEKAHYGLEFTVTAADDSIDAEALDPEPAPSLEDLFAPGAVFDPERGSCGCHTQEGDLAHALLDLRTPAAAFDDLVVPTRRRDTGFPMVTPRRPSESFLLHKLLRDEHGRAIPGVLGGPMPPDGALPYRDLVSIARWIEVGAPLLSDR